MSGMTAVRHTIHGASGDARTATGLVHAYCLALDDARAFCSGAYTVDGERWRVYDFDDVVHDVGTYGFVARVLDELRSWRDAGVPAAQDDETVRAAVVAIAAAAGFAVREQPGGTRRVFIARTGEALKRVAAGLGALEEAAGPQGG